MSILGALGDPMKFAKKEVMKVDFDKDGIPDVIELLDAGEAGAEVLAEFFDDFDAEEAAGVLTALNSFRKPEKRKTDAEVQAAASAAVAIAPAMRAVKQVMEQVEADLKKS